MAKLERTDKPVSVLIEELGEGALGLPEIQRSYVWNRPQARDLVDSLYREYPSGLILLWKPKEFPELREPTLDEDRKKAPDFLILDGQQRLTSLIKIFSGEIDVYFNVEEESFQIYNQKLKANPLWISVKDVINKGAVKVWRELKTQLDSFLFQTDDSKLDVYLDRLSSLEKIKEYRYPVMIIHTDDYEEITESFIRVNSRGTRLREAELAMAQLAFRWPGALVKEFENALDEYEQANYDLEARFLMRCFVAIGTGQSRFRYLSALWKKSPTELENIWKRTKKAVDHTINFLKNNAGIESSDWIPSINALVPLVVYLSKKQGQIIDDEVKGLLFWFFEATIHGRFTGSPETKIDQDLKAIESSNSINGMIANLRRDVPSFDITPEMIEGKYQRHSFLPLIFTILREKNAKDWFTGTVLSSTNVGPEHQLELHHIFPKAILKESGDFKTHEIDDIANIAFLSQKANRTILKSKPEKYLSNIEADRLKDQLVPLDTELRKVENFRDFIVERRKLLKEAINEYMRKIGRGYFNI
ncbi:DUF262 domain-containing protein [Thermosipho sp. (in: thermotogales)]|jgi:hypothetical protein|uniref:GmrSD restriction endonuclease domain-containing protein n=1 Tax=Thermosipho sp. (in: thermotogales) TaxID=1968895 RepID=UPI00257DE621|nr:DUF262 domain-containing protein [Thermosipho sp. (in: thermotogales)]MBZ4651052.1 hypothetical protein [Thermosipho sp. (in: thermotogales)]